MWLICHTGSTVIFRRRALLKIWVSVNFVSEPRPAHEYKAHMLLEQIPSWVLLYIAGRIFTAKMVIFNP